MKVGNYRTCFDYLTNNPSQKEKFKDTLKNSKLFLLKKDLFYTFANELKGQGKEMYPKLNPYDKDNPNPQLIFELPFDSIFLEFSESIEIGGYISYSLVGFLVEDCDKTPDLNNENYKDCYMITVFLKIGELLNSVPVKIKKYLSKEHPDLINEEVNNTLMLRTLAVFGFDTTFLDTPQADNKILDYNSWKYLQNTENAPYYHLLGHISNELFIAISILQFINSINSEIVYIGSTDLDRKKRLNSGQIPIPETYTIYLKEKPIKKRGYLFDGSNFSSSYIYDVRGHKRHYRNKEKYKTLYSIHKEGKLPEVYKFNEGGIIYRWINSFKRGSGFYIKKQYNISKSDYHKL
jgi:hypothetical protein